MTEPEEAQFFALIRALSETFGAKLTDGQAMGYRMGLDGIPLADLEKGVARAFRECKFMPKPVELRDMSGEMPLAVKAALAWGVAHKAVHQHGFYTSVDFADPVINAVIRNMGGWMDFSQRDADTFQTFTRKEFERLFIAFSPTGVSAEAGRYLFGKFEGNGINPVERVPVPYEVTKPNGQRQAINGFVAGLLGEGQS